MTDLRSALEKNLACVRGSDTGLQHQTRRMLLAGPAFAHDPDELDAGSCGWCGPEAQALGRALNMGGPSTLLLSRAAAATPRGRAGRRATGWPTLKPS